MDIDVVKEAWKEQTLPPASVAGEGRSAGELRARLKRFSRTLFWRDFWETAVAVPLFVFFAYVGWVTKNPLVEIGSGVIVVGLVVIVVILQRSRRRYPLPPNELSLAEFLRAELARIDVQIRLLKNVFWWYLGPLGLGVLLVYAGRLVRPDGPTTVDVVIVVLGFVVLAVLFAGIFHLNQLAVRTQLRPLRDEIAGHLRELEPPPDESIGRTS